MADADIDFSLNVEIRNTGTKAISQNALIRNTGTNTISMNSSIRHAGIDDMSFDALIRNMSTEAISINASIRNIGVKAISSSLTIRKTNTIPISMNSLIRNASTEFLSSNVVIRHSSSLALSTYARIRHSGSIDLPQNALIRNAGIAVFSFNALIRNKSSKNLSLWTDIRHETGLWCKVRSIHVRLGIDAKDIRDLHLEDFILEAMIDVQTELDLADVDYSSWIKYSLVPNSIRIATMYGAIVILIARKVQSFKTRLIPSVGPMRYEVIERDSTKAIKYFEGRRDLALEQYVDKQIAVFGSAMSSSTMDEEPVFDMIDLQDKVGGVGERSWYRWLLGG